jgi:hypothetical protein
MTAQVTGAISIAIISFELTQELSYCLPVLIASVAAIAVGNCFGNSFFDEIGEVRKLPKRPVLQNQKSHTLKAEDVMCIDIELFVERKASSAQIARLVQRAKQQLGLNSDDDDEEDDEAAAEDDERRLDKQFEAQAQQWESAHPSQAHPSLRAVTVQPSKLTVQPSKLTVQPSKLTVQPSKLLQSNPLHPLSSNGVSLTVSTANGGGSSPASTASNASHASTVEPLSPGSSAVDSAREKARAAAARGKATAAAAARGAKAKARRGSAKAKAAAGRGTAKARAAARRGSAKAKALFGFGAQSVSNLSI